MSGYGSGPNRSNYKTRLYIKDAPVELESKPFFYENSVYVPLREVSELADKPAQISWDNGKITMLINGHSHYYEMKIGENKLMLRPYNTATHYDESLSPISPDANWYTVGENVKATIYTTGARPKKITAYYTDSGTEMV